MIQHEKLIVTKQLYIMYTVFDRIKLFEWILVADEV